jgi:anti-sigma B factor antagonist
LKSGCREGYWRRWQGTNRREFVQAYLSVAVRESERSIVVYVEGELDLASSVDLADVISRVARRSARVVVDLEKLRFIDMAGLRVLVSAYDDARDAGRRVVLANVREPVRRVLTLAQAGPLLPRLQGEDAA